MQLTGERGNIFEELDPRMKLLILVVFSTFTFLSFDNATLIYNYSLIVFLFLLSKLYVKGIKVAVYIAMLLLIGNLSGLFYNQQFADIFSVIVQLLQRISVFLIMGIWMSSTIKVGDFVTSMEKMHIPKGITITLAVVFRYLPTVRQEFYYIKNTMRLRGIGLNAKNIFLHPIRTIEYSVVPMIIRSIKIADELSASAMTRGLDLETKRISYREVKISGLEVIITVAFIVAIVCGFIFSTRQLGGAL